MKTDLINNGITDEIRDYGEFYTFFFVFTFARLRSATVSW